MAARPAPLIALKLCRRLAHTSSRRLESAIYVTQAALDNNTKLTAAERDAYEAAISTAKRMSDAFERIEKIPLPKDAPKTARRPGRPTKADVARAEALRAGKTRKSKAR